MTNTQTSLTNGKNRNMLCEQDLRQFAGTEAWYRHPLFGKFLYTEGVQYVAEKGEAYWLLDKIFACTAHIEKLSREEFLVWELIRNNESKGAKVICTDGNCNELYREEIDFTDFPLRSIKFYFTDNALLLPSEY